VAALVAEVLGKDLLGAYLYGSALAGGLRPGSDLDVLAVTRRRTSPAQRRALIAGLRPLSARDGRPHAWRPVELTIAALPDIAPPTYPPRVDFQSGEWLRAEFDAGQARPWRTPNPDLLIVLAQVRWASTALLGPDADALLPEIPATQLARAMTDEIDNLLAELEIDTANVLLTLARIWHTLATQHFAAKDAAADWATARLQPSARLALEAARTTYTTGSYDDWSVAPKAGRATADALVRNIGREQVSGYNRTR
jgi:streptomycin 3"-adenylyltransferase